jgi:hypothetical protein
VNKSAGHQLLRFTVATLIVALLACSERKPAPNGQLQAAARVQLDTNRAVEVLGLRWWSVEMLQDSLAKYAPDVPLDSASIPAILRERLHFADAAVHRSEQIFDENESAQVTIALREPGDSARVHFRPQTLDTIARVAEWKAITSKLTGTANEHLLDVVVASHLEGPARTTVDSSSRNHPVTIQIGYPFESPEDSLAARPIIEAIAKRSTDRDFTAAVQTLDRSTSLPDRIVAVLVLANFPKRDSAWRALVTACVGQQQAADAATAAHALQSMAERFPRVVDWMPIAPTIHDILDGTALMTLPRVASALASTGVSPRDAKAFLANGGEMLVAHLESANTDLSEPAHRLLVALRGSDIGSDLVPWRAWIRTL